MVQKNPDLYNLSHKSRRQTGPFQKSVSMHDVVILFYLLYTCYTSSKWIWLWIKTKQTEYKTKLKLSIAPLVKFKSFVLFHFVENENLVRMRAIVFGLSKWLWEKQSKRSDVSKMVHWGTLSPPSSRKTLTSKQYMSQISLLDLHLRKYNASTRHKTEKRCIGAGRKLCYTFLP